MSYFQRIGNFNFSKTLHFEDIGDVVAKIDITNKDKIADFSFDGHLSDDLKKQFESLGQALIGQTIFEIKAMPMENERGLFSLPYILLMDLIDQYEGRVPALNELKKQPESELICRCFGIYKSEVQAYLKQHPDKFLKDLTAATGAGGGCTSCLEDLDIIFENQARPKAKLKASAVTVMLKAQEIIESQMNAFDFSQKDFEIVKFKNLSLEIKMNFEGQEKVAAYLSTELQDNFHESIEVIVFSF